MRKSVVLALVLATVAVVACFRLEPGHLTNPIPQKIQAKSLTLLLNIELIKDSTSEYVLFTAKPHTAGPIAAEEVYDNDHRTKHAVFYWKYPRRLAVGECWQIQVKANSNGPWWVSEAARQPRCDVTNSYVYRDQLMASVAAKASVYGLEGWTLALAFGYKGLLSQSQRDLLKATGTQHLFVVSGLHLGLVFGWVYWFGLRGFFKGHIQTRRGLSAMLGFSAALCYALVSGFLIPSQRALIALAFTILLLIRGWSFLSIVPWALAIGILVAVGADHRDPSFIMSFGATLIIVTGFLTREQVANPHDASMGRRWVRYLSPWFLVQFRLFWGMGAILLLLGFDWALGSFVANLIAVPWVSLVLAPSYMMVMMSELMGIDAVSDSLWVWLSWNFDWLELWLSLYRPIFINDFITAEIAHIFSVCILYRLLLPRPIKQL